MRAALVLALVAGGFVPAGADRAAAAGGDPDAGRKVANMCRTCHGTDGIARIPIAPNIGGEPAAYLAAQLDAFRSGAREHEMMTIVARGLSDAQIADVSAWYALHAATATMAADPADAPELCVACHGADGIALSPDAPHLAGETAIYIDTQLKAFRSGKRVHEVMSGIASGLTDAEIRAYADWYAATKLTVTGPN
jgi:cytochrome c553